MASSMMSAAIRDIRKDFPGYSSEMYIMSKSLSCHNSRMLMHSHVRFRPRLCGRPIDMGAMLRSLWSTNHVLHDIHSLYSVQCRLLRRQEFGGIDRPSIPCWYFRCFLFDFYWVGPISCSASVREPVDQISGIIADMFNAAERGSAMGVSPHSSQHMSYQADVFFSSLRSHRSSGQR